MAKIQVFDAATLPSTCQSNMNRRLSSYKAIVFGAQMHSACKFDSLELNNLFVNALHTFYRAVTV